MVTSLFIWYSLQRGGICVEWCPWASRGKNDQNGLWNYVAQCKSEILQEVWIMIRFKFNRPYTLHKEWLTS
jgi:hypothetical protein